MARSRRIPRVCLIPPREVKVWGSLILLYFLKWRNKQKVCGAYLIRNNFKCNFWSTPPHLKKNVWLSFKIDSVAYSDNDSVKEQVLVKCPFKYPQKEDLKGHTYSISLRECLDCGGFTLWAVSRSGTVGISPWCF